MVNWQFDEIQSNRYQGINDSGLETFNGNAIKSLVRETIQNSLDAVKDESRPVRISFKVEQVETKSIPGYESHLQSIMQCVKESMNKKDEKAHQVFKEMVEIYRAETISVLVISDYNTTGLTKISEGDGSFDSLIKSEGYSYKEISGAGGSFGIGKNAAFSSSKVRTVFYNTLNEERELGFQGVTILTSHKSPQTDRLRLAKGFFPIEPITTSHNYFKSVLDRVEPGTDVIIVGFKDDKFEKTCSDVIVNNFFMSLEKNKLQVEVNNNFISKESYGNIITKNYKESLISGKSVSNRIKEIYRKNYHMYNALRENSFVKTIKVGDVEDSIEIYMSTSKVEKMENEVIGIRSTGMSVNVFKNFRTKLKFAGIVYIESNELNIILKNMENPQHNKWEPDRHPKGKKEGLLVIKEIRTAITDVINKLTEDIEEDDEFITGLNDLFNVKEYKTAQNKIKLRTKDHTKQIQSIHKVKENTVYNVIEKIYGTLTPVEKKKLEIEQSFKKVDKKSINLSLINNDSNSYVIKFKPKKEGNYYFELNEMSYNGSKPFTFVKFECTNPDIKLEQILTNGLACLNLVPKTEYEIKLTSKNNYRCVVEVNVYHVEK